MANLEWGDPPQRNTRGRLRRDFTAEAQELKTRPGEWGCIWRGSSNSSLMEFRRGSYPTMPASEFDFMGSPVPPLPGRVATRYDIYARYVGKPDRKRGSKS